MAEMNGTGQGGKTYEDRLLAGRVRKLALEEIEAVLMDRDHKLYGAVIVKLAGTVLPRLNEHTGAEGKDLFPTPILDVSKDNRTEEDTKAD